MRLGLAPFLGNIFLISILQFHLVKELRMTVFWLLTGGQEGEVGGRRVPPDLLMENFNQLHQNITMLKLEVCISAAIIFHLPSLLYRLLD